ncbi:sulfotransferase [Immundisolibacter sp.]|uniref:sulfotransferase family protein n=1 Tax=Immundisolibacter sp. TaxID=1934948 RepID=UPI003566AF5C
MGNTVELKKPVRRFPVRIFNYVAERLPSIDERLAIDADSLMARACQFTRLQNFGERSFVEAFEILVDDINGNAQLNRFGRFAWKGMLHTLLCNRLYMEEKLRLEPAIAKRQIASPIFVLGFPRTGSTFLHTLLACDPAARYLSAAESMRAQGDPRRRPLPGTLQRLNARWGFALLDYLAPGFKTIHAEPVDGPAECGGLLLHSFATAAFLPSLNVPQYAQWLKTLDYGPTARYHRHQLCVLDALHSGSHWVLKSPAHLPMIDALIKTYPDARFVFLHRDAVKVVASFCSLVGLTRGIYSDALDGSQIGQQTADTLGDLLRRALDARQRHDPRRFVDVQYADLVADPLGAVSGIYRQFGWTMPPAMEARVRNRVETTRNGLHTRHRYELTQFGLSRQRVQEQFDWYSKAFEIPEEKTG